MTRLPRGGRFGHWLLAVTLLSLQQSINLTLNLHPIFVIWFKHLIQNIYNFMQFYKNTNPPYRISRTYISFGLKRANAVEDHVKGSRKEPTFPRRTSHGKGLTTSSNAICKQQTCRCRRSQPHQCIFAVEFYIVKFCFTPKQDQFSLHLVDLAV